MASTVFLYDYESLYKSGSSASTQWFATIFVKNPSVFFATTVAAIGGLIYFGKKISLLFTLKDLAILVLLFLLLIVVARSTFMSVDEQLSKGVLADVGILAIFGALVFLIYPGIKAMRARRAQTVQSVKDDAVSR